MILMNWTHGLRNISLNTEQWYWTETEILFPMQFVFCCDDDILVNNSKMFDEKTEQFVLESINYCNIRTHIMKLKLSLRIARKYKMQYTFVSWQSLGPPPPNWLPLPMSLCLCMGMCQIKNLSLHTNTLITTYQGPSYPLLQLVWSIQFYLSGEHWLMYSPTLSLYKWQAL